MTEVGRGALRKFDRARLNVPSALYLFAALLLCPAAPVIVYSPVQVYSNPPSAVPVVLQVPDPLMPFIFPVPPVI